uniref:SSD domain-containing protein n=1 Tax=Meloidogyne incognita TaxID=6306 RepID=A0A914NJG9_MELIC
MLRKKFEHFSNFIFTNPAIICSFLFIFAFILPIILLFVFPLRLGNNPEKGFETDGTEYSKTRLTWTRLQPYLLQGSQVEFNLENENNLQKRINKRSWANDLINSMFSAVTCYDEPIPAMSFLSQFVIEIADKDKLFSLEFIQQLCSLQQKLFLFSLIFKQKIFLILSELSSFSSFTLYKNIWSWSNFVNCLAPNQRDNCSQISEEDVNNFKNIFFHYCLPHRQTILDCGRICGQIKSSVSGNILNTSQRQKRQFTSLNNLFEEEEFIEEKNKCFEFEICLKIPKGCKGQMWFDLFYRILPEDVHSKPTSLFELKGLSLDTKRDLLLEAALNDSKLTLISAFIVFALLAIYSLSIVFALIVSLQLASSVFISLAIFRLFISSEIPELNLISFVLLISVGSDGAFLLLDVFPAPERLTPTTLNKALKHIAKTMFLTQFSTVIPFMLNLLSSVYAFRSFGLFAGLTLIFNYFLLVTFLPAFLVLQSRWLNPWFVRWWPSRCWYCFSGIGGGYSGTSPPLGGIKQNQQHQNTRCSPLLFKFPTNWLERYRHFNRLVLDDILPSVLIQGRFVWLGSLFIFFGINIYLICTQLSLPRYNPLQLFRASNTHEFYDQVWSRILFIICLVLIF